MHVDFSPIIAMKVLEYCHFFDERCVVEILCCYSSASSNCSQRRRLIGRKLS